MNFPLTIARRYLASRKTTNAINIITAISILGIAIGTAALILILSVFNGFEGLMKDNLDKFNPDYKLTSPEGKYFKFGSEELTGIKNLPGVISASRVLEELALLEYRDQQMIGIVKGVDDQYLRTTNLEKSIIGGAATFYSETDGHTAVIGQGISSRLAVSLRNRFDNLMVYVPNRKRKSPLDKDFKSRSLKPTGVFSIQNERDNQYILTNYDIVSEMLDLRGSITAVEIRTAEGTSESEIREQLMKLGLDQYVIQNRLEQDESFLKITNIEKWTSYLIFSFVMILIIFNLVGCLWMIVLEKRKDISVLQSVGATKQMIRRIILFEGGLISLSGFGIGFIFALLFYILQQNFGIIPVPDGFSISSYPMIMRWSDVTIIFITVLFLGLIASLPATWRANRISAYVRTE
jgi:lipoprotein-releasing system permease protein